MMATSALSSAVRPAARAMHAAHDPLTAVPCVGLLATATQAAAVSNQHRDVNMFAAYEGMIWRRDCRGTIECV